MLMHRQNGSRTGNTPAGESDSKEQEGRMGRVRTAQRCQKGQKHGQQTKPAQHILVCPSKIGVMLRKVYKPHIGFTQSSAEQHRSSQQPGHSTRATGQQRPLWQVDTVPGQQQGLANSTLQHVTGARAAILRASARSRSACSLLACSRICGTC